MELMLIRLFQRQVRDQCQFMLAGAQKINEGLAAPSHDKLWLGCQMLLVGAANVSKALWGSGGKLAEQRLPLRESLGVDDESPFRIVGMRNNFEHFDERLDRWWNETPNRLFVDQMIGPPEVLGGDGFPDINRFRVYDDTRHEIVFWGQRFDVQAIVTAAGELFGIAHAESSKPMIG